MPALEELTVPMGSVAYSDTCTRMSGATGGTAEVGLRVRAFPQVGSVGEGTPRVTQCNELRDRFSVKPGNLGQEPYDCHACFVSWSLQKAVLSQCRGEYSYCVLSLCLRLIRWEDAV